jgi:hypothetical protein
MIIGPSLILSWNGAEKSGVFFVFWGLRGRARLALKGVGILLVQHLEGWDRKQV